MAKRQAPRWMTGAWAVLVLCIVGSYMGVALRRGYDFVLIIGFMAGNFVDIFTFSVLAGLLVYGLSFALPPRCAQKPPDDAEGEHSNDMSNIIIP